MGFWGFHSPTGLPQIEEHGSAFLQNFRVLLKFRICFLHYFFYSSTQQSRDDGDNSNKF